ncbi:MAG TPA: hypothetical protein VGH04_15735 [Gemmatimonadaceae bacterium]
MTDGPGASNDFVDVTAGVSCRGFAGATRFTIARRDLATFAAEIAALRRREADLAQLIGGWDTAEERFRLRVTRAGTTDSCAIRVRVASPGARTDQWDRAETQFICSAGAVTAFADALASDTSNSVQLAGDAESAA